MSKIRYCKAAFKSNRTEAANSADMKRNNLLTVKNVMKILVSSLAQMIMFVIAVHNKWSLVSAKC